MLLTLSVFKRHSKSHHSQTTSRAYGLVRTFKRHSKSHHSQTYAASSLLITDSTFSIESLAFIVTLPLLSKYSTLWLTQTRWYASFLSPMYIIRVQGAATPYPMTLPFPLFSSFCTLILLRQFVHLAETLLTLSAVKRHPKLHHSQTGVSTKVWCTTFKRHPKLHHSQTWGRSGRGRGWFKRHPKLHHSQTIRNAQNWWAVFKRHPKLHHSQTAIKLISHSELFKRHPKLHHSQTAKQKIALIEKFKRHPKLHHSQTLDVNS